MTRSLAACTVKAPGTKPRLSWTSRSTSQRGQPINGAATSRGDQLPLVGKSLRVDFLGSFHGRAVGDRSARGLGQNVFERGQNADGVQIVVVADVRDAEKFSLHLALTVGHYRIK